MLVIVAVVMTAVLTTGFVMLMFLFFVAHAFVLVCVAAQLGSSMCSVNELNDAPSSSVASNSTSDAESLASGGA